MKRLIMFAFAVLSLALSAGAQEINDENVNGYLNWARKLVEEADHLENVKREVISLQKECDSLRVTWNRTCMDYLASSAVRYTDDLDYLIQNTDPQFDGQELYDLLLAEREKAVERKKAGRTAPESPSDDRSGGYLDERVLRSLK